jgi:glycerophosphoryl diester phosphodiesterase
MTHTFVLWLALIGQSAIPDGADTITMEVGPGRTPIEVFTYKPESYRDGPLILVFHGILRNADEYRDHSKALADRLGALIAAPRFDKERFPNERYQQGGVRRQEGPVPRDDWTFSRIPEIAAEIRKREQRPGMPYYLLGHSAGGQFVERLAGFIDSGAMRIVAANPGTHLFPTRDQNYPYGFGGLLDDLSNERALRRYLAQPLTIYLGTADVEIDRNLTVGPEADAQGPVRLARGQNLFEFARSLAHERGWAFHWRLVEAPGVKHDHTLMFDHPRIAAALFGLNPANVVGHRGLFKEAPENTLANFRACLDLRLGIEFDVQRTHDGHLVCLHDETVDRTTDGHGKVSELTLEQVRHLDAGRWFSPEFAGQWVPTIDEVFALIESHGRHDNLFAVDIKATDADIEADLVRLATEHNVLDRLVFIGRTIDDAHVRQRLRQASAKVRVARLVASPADIAPALEDPLCDWLYIRFIPDGSDAARIQIAGKRLFLAGSLAAGREPANWRSAATAGVDAILTDYPLDLRRELVSVPEKQQKE